MFGKYGTKRLCAVQYAVTLSPPLRFCFPKCLLCLHPGDRSTAHICGELLQVTESDCWSPLSGTTPSLRVLAQLAHYYLIGLGRFFCFRECARFNPITYVGLGTTPTFSCCATWLSKACSKQSAALILPVGLLFTMSYKGSIASHFLAMPSFMTLLTNSIRPQSMVQGY
jgi:hypothetical protein